VTRRPLATYRDLALADVFRRVRTGDAIIPGPVMLIGSYRSFPCVAPIRQTFFPSTLPDSSEETVIAAPGGPNASAYTANRLLDTNRDGKIAVSDLTARINNVRQGDRRNALTARHHLCN
jgi:hypothetical protein